jgi:hypothetical protein
MGEARPDESIPLTRVTWLLLRAHGTLLRWPALIAAGVVIGGNLLVALSGSWHFSAVRVIATFVGLTLFIYVALLVSARMAATRNAK